MFFFIEKKRNGTRIIKTENWYIELTPTGDGKKQIFDAVYYEHGRTKLQFKVSDTYSRFDVEEPKSEDGIPRLKEGEEGIIIYKMKEFFKMFPQMDRLEELEKKLWKSK